MLYEGVHRCMWVCVDVRNWPRDWPVLWSWVTRGYDISSGHWRHILLVIAFQLVFTYFFIDHHNLSVETFHCLLGFVMINYIGCWNLMEKLFLSLLSLTIIYLDIFSNFNFHTEDALHLFWKFKKKKKLTRVRVWCDCYI